MSGARQQRGTPRKYSEAVYMTLYLSKEAVDKAKAKCAELGIPFSPLVSELLLKWAEGKDNFAKEYDYLKRKYYRHIIETRRLTQMLEDLGGADDLNELAQDLGLDMKTLSNLDEIVPKLEEAYNGPAEKLHLFIDLLELAKERVEIGAKLSEMRRRKYRNLSVEGAGVAEARPDSDSLQGAGSVSEMREPQSDENPRPEIPA